MMDITQNELAALLGEVIEISDDVIDQIKQSGTDIHNAYKNILSSMSKET